MDASLQRPIKFKSVVHVALQGVHENGFNSGESPELPTQEYNPLWSQITAHQNGTNSPTEACFKALGEWAEPDRVTIKSPYSDQQSFSFLGLTPPNKHGKYDIRDTTKADAMKEVISAQKPDFTVLIGKPISGFLQSTNMGFGLLLDTLPGSITVMLTVGPSEPKWRDNMEQTIRTVSKRTDIFFLALPDPLPSDAIETVLALLHQIIQQQGLSKVVDYEELIPQQIPKVPKFPSKITIVSGSGLTAGDLNGKSDPFCIFGVGPTRKKYQWGPHQTKVKKATLDPVWTKDDNNSAVVEKGSLNEFNSTLWIEVWDEDLVGKDRLGGCSVSTADLKVGEMVLPVKPVKKEKASGTIKILLE